MPAKKEQPIRVNDNGVERDATPEEIAHIEIIRQSNDPFIAGLTA